ncbi:MAG: hypothetical protein C5B47_01940 [Verrucomicrobia bacterium]|nr:MAG: hypothetical protein C5B47_01940 [Verrucomicrobiota bacterium]
MELTEKSLMAMGGPKVFCEARAIRAAGRVSDAAYEPPLLKGKVREGGKQFLAGLRIRNTIDVENLCPCKDSRLRGVICAHSVAVGLQILSPVSSPPPSIAPQASSEPASRQITDEIPQVELRLEGSLRHVEAEIYFHYTESDKCNPLIENRVYAELLSAGFEQSNGKAVLRGENSILHFYTMVLPKCRHEWKIVEGDRFRHVTEDLVPIEPRFAIREKDDTWLDVRIHYTAGNEAFFSQADMQRLLLGSQPYIRLKNGKIAVANPSQLRDVEEVLRDCNPIQEPSLWRVPKLHQAYLQNSVSEWSGLPPSVAVNTPPIDLGTLLTRLRPYQIQGAKWLAAHSKAGLGGLLADEMGLGKTIQALALLEIVKGPALVVCPSSLVWNWKREAKEFLPRFKVLTLDGPDREPLFSQIPDCNLAITSYALLRRDIDRYRDVLFSTIVLDEAQHIKNPESQNAKAACVLRARSRFILTGTPIENSIRDLWSLFDFCLPGYLGSRQDFKDRYEAPLLEGAKEDVARRLSRRIQPYVLRRLKRDVLQELPEKIEQIVEVELTPRQKAAYAGFQIAARKEIDALTENSGSGAARMRVLTALLRLRQLCCDLRLLRLAEVEEKQSTSSATSLTSPSSKIPALLELLQEAVDGGHRVLVFSQFTSMLDLIGAALNEENISFCRLDGSTRDREGVVRRFQEDASLVVFLMSLKAGGVGLNLTAADTVIHFDPWWNPAAEDQATDRAHRMGQKRSVTSIKLIARDTIEERVLRMQQTKRELMSGTLDADAALGKMSVGELRELVS